MSNNIQKKSPAEERSKEKGSGELTLSLRDHNIGFSLPFGSRMEGKLFLPSGALIQGDFIGDIYCETGDVIITKGARFSGQIEADNIYIEGEVAPIDRDKKSIIIGRALVSLSEFSRINADIYTPALAHHKGKLWGTVHTLEEALDVRKMNRASADQASSLPFSGAAKLPA